MKKILKTIFFVLFLASLLYYVGWLIYAVYLSQAGIDSGWAMPAWSDGSYEYGLDAFWSGIAIGILWTAEIYWFIPLYQAVYLIVTVILKIAKKVRKKSSAEAE